MILKKLLLHDFRNYTASLFTFDDQLTVIVGKNTAGKTNLTEAIYWIATGKSFHAEKDTDVIAFSKSIARIKAVVIRDEEEVTLESLFVIDSSQNRFSKKYLVNSIPRRRVDFAGVCPVVLFNPTQLDIIIGSPSLRRDFLDSVLEQVDREYLLARSLYDKALKQRNALLKRVKETGKRDQKMFTYWDDLLVQHATSIMQKREALITFLNEAPKSIIPFSLVYEKNIFSKERLLSYEAAETALGVTLIGPHRDDVTVYIHRESDKKDAKQFASRGQQRLVVLQLKVLQLDYITQWSGVRPLCILDDIFSELDEEHMQLIWTIVYKQQTIITTTHKEFIPEQTRAYMIELNKNHE